MTIALSSSDRPKARSGPASLTFTAANWNVAQTVTVTGVDDAVDDGDIAYTISVDAAATAPTRNYNGLNPADVSVTNTDNDTAGITVRPSAATPTEAGGTATFTVVLNSQPTRRRHDRVSSSDLTEGTVGRPR